MGAYTNTVPRVVRSVDPVASLTKLTVLGFWTMILWYAYDFAIGRQRLAILFIGFCIAIYMLGEIRDVRDAADSDLTEHVIPAACILVAVVCTAYFSYYFDVLYGQRVGYVSTLDIAMAVPIFLVVMYITYREFGLPFIVVVGGAILYAYFGYLIPGTFGHAGLSYGRVIGIIGADIQGIFGSLSQIMAAWIALFFLFAGLFQGYGGFKIIMKGALRIATLIVSGVALTAVIASSIMGSINGSSTANTGITGSITIPMMKNQGLSPESSAAIESVASNGGQIMPPIMGATAFVMASLLARPYSDILIAGIIPALLYFICVGFAVHFTVLRELESLETNTDISADDFDDERAELFESDETKGELVMEVLRFGIPTAVLVYLLAVAQWTLISAAFYSVLTMALTGTLFPILYYRTREAVKGAVTDTMEGLTIGATLSASVGIVIAALNVVADVLMATGMPSALTLAIMDIAGGVMFLAILFAVIICIILGMGMPTIAAYLIVALLVSPAIINNFGVPELTTHFFVFYAANLSTITPPIAASVIVATGIAGSNFWKTSLLSVKISAPIFVLPFTFIYNPGIISATFSVEAIYLGVLTFLGALTLVYGLNYPGNISKGRVVRSVFIVAGLLIMVHPSISLKILLLVLTAAVLFVQQRYLTIEGPVAQ